MLAAVTDFVLPALFLSSGVFALAALAMTWLQYGAQFRALRAELAALGNTREFVFRMSTVEVPELAPPTRGGRVRQMDRAVQIPAQIPVRKLPALRVAA